MLTKEERDALRSWLSNLPNGFPEPGTETRNHTGRLEETLGQTLDALDEMEERNDVQVDLIQDARAKQERAEQELGRQRRKWAAERQGMEAERDEFRELLRMERSACYVAEQAADVAIAIKEKAQRERDQALSRAEVATGAWNTLNERAKTLERERDEARGIASRVCGYDWETVREIYGESEPPVQSVWRPHPDGGLVGGGEDGREFWVKRHPEGGWMLLWRGQWAGGNSLFADWSKVTRAMQQAWWLQLDDEHRATAVVAQGKRHVDAPPEWTTLPEGWEP